MIPINLNSDFLTRLRPYVAPAEILPAEFIEGAPEILPGIVVAVALEDGGRVDVLATASLLDIVREIAPQSIEQAPALLRGIAIENLRRLPLPPLQILFDGERSGSAIVHLEIEDPFVASRITFLDELAERIAPGRFGKHGVLVAIPRRRTLQLHFPSGPDVVWAFEGMQLGAEAIFRETPHSKLSPHVYYVAPDGNREIVARLGAGVHFTRLLYGSNGLLSRG